MGAGWPKPALVEPFTSFQAWDHGKASEVVCVFKDNEFDFGVDVDVVAALLEGDRKTAEAVEKIRINPGNFADGRKQDEDDVSFDSEADFLKPRDSIVEAFAPLVLKCKELNRAMRIGTNHGSLSARIMSYYGDSAAGMVASAVELADTCRKHDYHNFVFSMKASNPKVMIECYRLLVAHLAELGPDWNYPIHLGVTEAGEGEEGDDEQPEAGVLHEPWDGRRREQRWQGEAEREGEEGAGRALVKRGAEAEGNGDIWSGDREGKRAVDRRSTDRIHS